jgi:hypothetical protein
MNKELFTLERDSIMSNTIPIVNPAKIQDIDCHSSHAQEVNTVYAQNQHVAEVPRRRCYLFQPCGIGGVGPKIVGPVYFGRPTNEWADKALRALNSQGQLDYKYTDGNRTARIKTASGPPSRDGSYPFYLEVTNSSVDGKAGINTQPTIIPLKFDNSANLVRVNQ